MPHIYLKPGEMHISTDASLVSTVLGSCVSVTLFCPRLRVGAISHGLLPTCREKGDCDGACLQGFKFVDCSIHHMLEEFRKLGVSSAEIEAKVFGGSDMFDLAGGSERISVGNQNVSAAMRIIELEGLRLVARDVGGTQGRKLLFYTHTGEVFLKRLYKGAGQERQ
jgi:chemotaxis protein CheD